MKYFYIFIFKSYANIVAYKIIIDQFSVKYGTMEELVKKIDNWDDDNDEIDAVMVLPPTNVDYVTDEENLDEDYIVMNEDISSLQELAM